MYFHLIYDSAHNMLIASPSLVGLHEIVEVYSPDEETPKQAGGRLLRKIAEPNVFIANVDEEGSDDVKKYELGDKCLARIMMKNLSGTRKRKFSEVEKNITSMEHDDSVKEHKVVRAKTGSIRRKKK
jgi:hypothetical protein